MIYKKSKEERGITLLIVVLIGSIILLTSVATGTYALRMVKALRARSDATQALYTADHTFNCVKYWLNKNTLNFTNLAPAGVVTCNGVDFSFNGIGSDSAADGHDPSYNGVFGEFRVPNDPSNPTGAGVLVKVYNSAPSSNVASTTVYIYSQTGAIAAGVKNSERFQKYNYKIRHGADIVYVVDRSGSIDRSLPAEWDAMLHAVTDSICVLNKKVPMPNIGLLSFGQNIPSVGLAKDAVGVKVGDKIVPDVPLTNTYTDLIDTKFTPSVADDVPKMRLDESTTNLSLGISIAGAALMDKGYPFSGLGSINLIPRDGKHSGDFEHIVASNLNFSILPDSPTLNMDRPDADYPDVIVVISDGAPNAFVTHRFRPGGFQYFWSGVFPSKHFIAPAPYDYQIGETKLFRTDPIGSGAQIVDNGFPTPPVAVVPVQNRWRWCNDARNSEPTTPSTFPGAVGAPLKFLTFPYFAMCNATLIARSLGAFSSAASPNLPPGQGNIKIIVIYVEANMGTTVAQESALWLENYLASPVDPAVPTGDRLFAQVNNYDEVKAKLVEMFEKLNLVQNI